MVWNKLKKLKKLLKSKKAIIIIVVVLAFFAVGQAALGQRISLPAWLYDSFQAFVRRDPNFSLEPYKNGTIILVKPIATGAGAGRYEAGDIVEIRDGSLPLGAEERTQLLPLYYAGKLTEEIKQKLMEPAYAKASAGKPEYKMTNDQIPMTNEIPNPNDKKEKDSKQMLKRRQFGVDYAKVLSNREIIKARQFEKLDRLPEIDLTDIIDKQSGVSIEIRTNKKSASKNEAEIAFNKQIYFDFPGKDIFQQLDSKIINFPENFGAGNSLSSLAKEANNNSASCWGRRSQTTEKIRELVNSQKSESLVTKTRFSLRESEDKNLSEEPLGDFFTSKLCECSNLKSSERTFSSSRNLSLGIDNDIIFLGQSGSVGQGGRDMFFSERGESAQNVSGGGAGREHIQNLPNHNSGSAESRLAVANIRIGHDVIINDNFHKNKFNNYNSYYSKNAGKLSTTFRDKSLTGSNNFSVIPASSVIARSEAKKSLSLRASYSGRSNLWLKSPFVRLLRSLALPRNDKKETVLASDNSAVNLPPSVIFYEKIKKSLATLARSAIPAAFADNPTESVKIVDPGAGTGFDYLSLNAWEAAQQADLTSTNQIAIAKCRSTGGKADTTAVTVDGWTTDSTRYVKIWTDPNESFRHSGKWDETKYSLQYTTNNFIRIYEDYVWLDGLQIKLTAASGFIRAIYITAQTAAANKIKMSNNIIWGVNSGSGYLYGINQDSVDDNSDIWNNVIYGFNSSVVISGIGYVYNNTVFNGAYGIMNYGTTIAKNNLVASTTDPYSGSFAVGTDYNATDINDAIGQGSNNRVSQTFLFADSANADYRLASGDTGALGWGVNLSADSSLAFTTDIEGQSRMASSTAFDIGADQFAATHIYRSVGPGKTTAFDIGASNAMTITGSSATFAAALPANVGVGDVIQYATTTGATVNSLAFISGRSSPTSFTVQDVSGHIASSTSANTGWSLFRAYTSLSLAEAGTENTGIASGLRNFDTWSGGKNLASSTEVWNIAAYGDAADTTAVSVSGWTTTASNYIKIYTPYLPSEVGVSQRHKGKWDNTKYRLEAGASTAMVKASVGYIRLEGLQLKIITASDYRSAISHESVAGDMYIDSNIIVGEITGSSVRAILLAIGNNYVNNNIIYGNFSSFGIGDYNNPSNIYAYNNTIYGIAGDAFRPSDSIFVAKNNIAYDNDTDYLGTFDSSSTNNLSKDATAPAYGTYYRNKKVNFVNTASTTAPDLHLLASDVWARDMGADLSGDANLSFNTDIDGGPRPAGRAFDIGADEMAGATQINSPLSGRFKDSSLVGYWSFDGADMNWASTTAEALDLSGNNNHGNVTNFDKKSVTPGINGQGMKFDGVDDYVDTGTPAVLNFGVNSPWTFSTWINPVSAPYPNYFNYRFVGPGGSGGAYLDIANLNHKFIYREGGGSYTEYSFSNESAADIFDKWTHLSFVADGAGNIALYKNGAYIETITGLVRTDFRPYKLGEGYTGKPLKGSLDDVRVYNRALSAGEISEQYKAGAARMKANAPTGASGGLSSASGLVGYWSFNGADMSWASTTAEALDRSGNSNNGNVTNFNNKSVTPGISGQALKFDGSDDYINIPDNGTILDFASTSPYTWSSWIKNASTTSGTSCFISKDICSNKAFGFNLCLNQTGSTADVVVCDFAAPGCNWQCSSGLSLGLSSNTWVHVVITYNGASGWGTYVNGVYKGDQTLFVNSDTTASYYIGSGNSSGLSQSPGRFFSGQIDDVRIFNRALTASEISQLYNSGGRKAEVTP